MITRRTVFGIANCVEIWPRRPGRVGLRIVEGSKTHPLFRESRFPQKPIFLSYTLTVSRRVILAARLEERNRGLLSPTFEDQCLGSIRVNIKRLSGTEKHMLQRLPVAKRLLIIVGVFVGI